MYRLAHHLAIDDVQKIPPAQRLGDKAQNAFQSNGTIKIPMLGF